MEHIFIRFTIKGDNLDLDQISNKIPFHTDVFKKGSVTPQKINPTRTHVQNTNRWVYTIESLSHENLNSVLKRMFAVLNSRIKEIQEYTKRYSSLFDIVIYTNTTKPISKYNIKLTKTNLKNISKLNTQLSVTVFDW